MRRVLSVVLILLGAGLGGVYPGTAVAFSIAVSLRSDAAWLGLTELFAVCGALLGMLAGESVQARPIWRRDVVLAVVVGLLVGTGGFVFCLWRISRADPPF